MNETINLKPIGHVVSPVEETAEPAHTGVDEEPTFGPSTDWD
jgi:hypothetical protein